MCDSTLHDWRQAVCIHENILNNTFVLKRQRDLLPEILQLRITAVPDVCGWLCLLWQPFNGWLCLLQLGPLPSFCQNSKGACKVTRFMDPWTTDSTRVYWKSFRSVWKTQHHAKFSCKCKTTQPQTMRGKRSVNENCSDTQLRVPRCKMMLHGNFASCH